MGYPQKDLDKASQKKPPAVSRRGPVALSAEQHRRASLVTRLVNCRRLGRGDTQRSGNDARLLLVQPHDVEVGDEGQVSRPRSLRAINQRYHSPTSA
jgi:hypothetical protein